MEEATSRASFKMSRGRAASSRPRRLEESSHRMDFDQRRLLAGATSRLEKARLRFTCGPLKSLVRAGVKAEEYEDEINDSKKSHVSEDGRRLLG